MRDTRIELVPFAWSKINFARPDAGSENGSAIRQTHDGRVLTSCLIGSRGAAFHEKNINGFSLWNQFIADPVSADPPSPDIFFSLHLLNIAAERILR